MCLPAPIVAVVVTEIHLIELAAEQLKLQAAPALAPAPVECAAKDFVFWFVY